MLICMEYKLFYVDMIFSDDAILLSFFSRYEGEEDELKDAIVKYSRGGVMESNRPAGIQAVKGIDDEADMVSIAWVTLR